MNIDYVLDFLFTSYITFAKVFVYCQFFSHSRSNKLANKENIKKEKKTMNNTIDNYYSSSPYLKEKHDQSKNLYENMSSPSLKEKNNQPENL